MDLEQKSLRKRMEEQQAGQDGSRKKTMVYQTTIAFILENKEAAIQKIRDNLEMFRENREKILLVFSPHENCDQLSHIDPALHEQFQAVVKDYLERDFGLYDGAHESEEMPECFDAYYGDASVLAHRCRNAGVPVMLEAII